jgi:transcriptional regulator with XRE-family HTH domain
MGKEKTEDPAMRKVRKLFEQSGLTQQVLGEKMGYSAASARQAVSQFLKSGDPQISMLRRFAKAMGVKVESLI